MLINDIIRTSRPADAMKSLLPYVFHLSGRLQMGLNLVDAPTVILSYVGNDLKSSNITVVLPQVNMNGVCNQHIKRMQQKCEDSGISTKIINISYSKTGVCMEPIRTKDVMISPMLFHILPKIRPDMPDAGFWVESICHLATMFFDCRPLYTLFTQIYGPLAELAKHADSAEKIELLCDTISEVFNEYADMKMISLQHMLGWDKVTDYTTIMRAYTKSYVDILRNIYHKAADPHRNQLVLAFAYEQLIYQAAFSTTDQKQIPIPLEKRIPTIFYSTITNNRSTNVSLQEIVTKSNLFIQMIENGQLSDMALESVSLGVSLNNIPISEEKEEKIAKKDCITPYYICGHLSEYLDELTPDDISFDIPEERLSMLVHDLGSNKFRVACESGDNYVHYYEDEAGSYKLFMAKDSARIVYGISTDTKHIELIRFSDGAPKYDYQYVH